MASLVTWLVVAWVIMLGVRQPGLRWFLGLSALFVSLIAGFSRVYLGVHWPSDVLAGWIAGLAWLGVCAWLVQGALTRWVASEYRALDRAG